MKSFYLLFLVSILSSAVLAQSNIPQVVSFSAVVRDANNQPLVNTPVSIRLTFKKGGSTGPLVYCALHQDVSNANGFISLQLNRNVLGTGCNGAPSTTFENIPWKEGGYWMEVEYQTVPNTPFTSLGQLELASSFYAFAAGSAEKVNGVNLDGANNGDVLSYNLTTGQWEPKPSGSGLPTGTTGTMLVHNGTSWTVLPAGSQGQVLTFCNGQPTWGPCLGALPTLSTTAVSKISTLSATSGGNISNDGGGPIIIRGVCWSTNQNPTIALATKTVDGTGTGTFTSNLTGLTPNTTYYVRSYASNSAGTAYGSQETFNTLTQSIFNPNLTYGTMSDIDGNSYKTIVIGTQTWMAENLKVSKYRDGTVIPTGLSDAAWATTTTGSYSIYNNDAANNLTYGKLYNFYAVTDGRNLCPTGWHVPSDSEWMTLENYLGDSSMAGGKLKSTSSLWIAPNTSATNESGFSGQPGGQRNIDGPFLNIGSNGLWWSSTEFPVVFSVWSRNLNYNDGYFFLGTSKKRFGGSVRCLKN